MNCACNDCKEKDMARRNTMGSTMEWDGEPEPGSPYVQMPDVQPPVSGSSRNVNSPQPQFEQNIDPTMLQFLVQALRQGSLAPDPQRALTSKPTITRRSLSAGVRG